MIGISHTGWVTRDPVVQFSYIFRGVAVVAGHVNWAAFSFFVGHHRSTFSSESGDFGEEVKLIEVQLLKGAPLLLWFDELLVHDNPNWNRVIVDGNVPAPASIVWEIVH